jgi:hypothetical protein
MLQIVIELPEPPESIAGEGVADDDGSVMPDGAIRRLCRR